MRTLKLLLLPLLLAVAFVSITPPSARASTVRDGVTVVAGHDSLVRPAALAPAIDSLALRPCVRLLPDSDAAASVGHAPVVHSVFRADSVRRHRSVPTPLSTTALLSILLVSVLGLTYPTVSQDKNSYPAMDTVRAQHNLVAADFLYYMRNHINTPSSPAVATVTQKVKTTASATYVRSGAPQAALAATDPFWDLTTAAQGTGVVAAASFIKYWLCVTAAGAAKVYSSTIAASAAACSFAGNPIQDGDTIMAVLTVATNGSTTFTPGTTALNAAGITATFVDGPDGSELRGSLVSP